LPHQRESADERWSWQMTVFQKVIVHDCRFSIWKFQIFRLELIW
jgi:hypothetical protein